MEPLKSFSLLRLSTFLIVLFCLSQPAGSRNYLEHPEGSCDYSMGFLFRLTCVPKDMVWIHSNGDIEIIPRQGALAEVYLVTLGGGLFVEGDELTNFAPSCFALTDPVDLEDETEHKFFGRDQAAFFFNNFRLLHYMNQGFGQTTIFRSECSVEKGLLAK
jgi:hypothetical protein